MDLENLILYIKNQIEKLEEEITEADKFEKEFEEIKSILYSEDINIDDVTQYVMSLKNFENYNESILKILNYIKLLSDLTDQIKNNIENIDVELYEWNLPDITDLFADINKLKKLYKYAINPNFKDEELKKSVFLLESRILDKINSDIYRNQLQLKKIVETIEIKVIKRYKIRDNIELLEKFKSYLDICTNRKTITTEEELKNFFEFIKKSNLSKDEIYRLIIDFSKSNIVYYNTLIRKKLSNDKLTVQENTKKVHDQMKRLANDQLSPVQTVSIDQIQTLTEEEKSIYDKVEKLLENYTYGATFYELYKDNFSLEDRVGAYGTEETLVFEDIKSDFEYILKPNLLGENKEKIFRIFNYILELNEKYLSNLEKIRLAKEKQEEEKRIVDNKIQEIIKIVEPIVKKHKHEIEKLNEDEKHKNLCKEIYSSSKISRESAKLIVKGLSHPVEYYELQYIINEISESYEYIRTNQLNFQDAEYMFNILRNLISEYSLILEKLPKEKTKEEEKYDGKNFVCFISEEIDYTDEGKKNEIFKSIKNLRNYEWSDIVACRPKNHLWSDLRYKLPNGKETNYKDEAFSAGRMWSTGYYRTGLIVIRNICHENKEKIKKRYNLEKVGVIAFIIGAIYVEADHSQYIDFVRFVNDAQNRATIDYYVDLFADPNTPEEKLFEILDKGINDCKQIKLDQPGIGGAVYG